MTIIKAHFDGRVLVPDEPVDLPRGQTLELHIHESRQDTSKGDIGLPTFNVPPDAQIVTSDAIRRAL